MTIIALWFAALTTFFPVDAAVTSLRVAPSSEKTEVVIHVDGDVEWKHTFLDAGNRLVVDLTGAEQGLRLDFEEINRGGVRGMRISQFQPRVVRVVIDLERKVQYQVSGQPGEIRVSFPNPTGEFEAWQMGLKGGPTPKVAKAAPETSAPMLPPSAARQVRQEPPVSVTFVDHPINDVLASFSELSGRSIVAAPGIASIQVNAEIKNQPWDLALEAILSSHGLIVTEQESGILIVESEAVLEDRARLEPTVTREFPINYISADSLVETVRSLLTRDRGTIAVNPSGNSLLVTDIRSVIDRISPIIRQLDVKPPQVAISAKLVFVDRTALEELGFVYDLKDSRGNQLNEVVPGFLDENGNGIFEPDERTDNNVVLLGGNSIAALANANFRVASPALEVMTSLVLGRHSLFTFIDALQSVSVSDIQAHPTITTVNHRQARIQVGERTPIRTIDAGAGTVGGEAPRATVRTEQTGVILQVTPHVTGNQILLDMHAERSNIAAAPSDLGATFATQEADTQVLVENGETAVIGGLTIIDKLKTRAGIPFLMDLPVIGALFRTDSERETKRDLLILVTPHIVRDGTQ